MEQNQTHLIEALKQQIKDLSDYYVFSLGEKERQLADLNILALSYKRRIEALQAQLIEREQSQKDVGECPTECPEDGPQEKELK